MKTFSRNSMGTKKNNLPSQFPLSINDIYKYLISKIESNDNVTITFLHIDF